LNVRGFSLLFHTQSSVYPRKFKDPLAKLTLAVRMPLPMADEKPSNSSVEPNPATDALILNSSAAQAEASTSSQRKTEVEEAADRLYEERIEEEYAKREGGA
jgi:hypothetical protein